MNGDFELKHDTASVHSMDSGYQSKSGRPSRSGPTMPEGYQSLAPQDTRSRVNSQFLGSEIYSPTLSSETFTAFPEQHQDMNMQLPSVAEDLEAGEGSFAYANYTTGQDYSHYTATSVPRYAPTSGIDMGSYWDTADSQTFATPYNFDPYTANQDSSEFVFNAPAPLQRHSMSGPRLDTSMRPTAARVSTPLMVNQFGPRRQSSNDAAFGAFVMSPTSAISTHIPSGALSDFEQHQKIEASIEREETASNSLAPQSIVDEDELLSPSDAAVAKDMEEEQGKAARSHPLYQAQPDESGKYRCPNQGKPGCNHKPTTLKCNYDKYVDSHLKPFRCNKALCVGVQFSSTACLLRHEREAHGKHGHGVRPHLCHFTDCERSVPGNGFPRRYNLFDHMKRVHDFTGPTIEASPPQPHQAIVSRKNTNRKRKSTADEGGEKRQKVSKPTQQQLLEQKRGKLNEAFLSKKQHIIDILASLSGPNDLRDNIQLTKEVVDLHELSEEYKNIGG